MGRRGAKTRKENSLIRAQALAELVLTDNPNLAAGGLRLLLPQLQEVEMKTLKSGESREKVTYKDAAECEAYLRNRIGEAKSANEVLELLADSVIAALSAGDRELPASRRIGWSSLAKHSLSKLLGAEIKSIRPRRGRAQ